MDTSVLREIENWEFEHTEHICYWTRECPDETDPDHWKGFALTISEKSDNHFQVSINIMFDGGGGDVLNSNKYSDTTTTLSEAMDIGETYVQQLEDEYGL